jgi:hypothetical protein
MINGDKMSIQYKSDKIRHNKIKKALESLSGENYEWTYEELSNADDLTLVTAAKNSSNEIEVHYAELWSKDCLNALFQKSEYKEFVNKPIKAIQKFFNERFIKIVESLKIEIVDYEISPVENEEFILFVEMGEVNEQHNINEVISEADYLSNRPSGDPRYQIDPMRASKPRMDTQRQNLPQGGQIDVPIQSDNRFNQVYMTRQKPQDAKIVDRLLKTVFEEKFNAKYSLSTDVGEWNPAKTLSTQEGKFYIMWEHAETNKIKIETTFFPEDTNKIIVGVTDATGKKLINTYFEIYRIPTDAFLVERFIRKVYFSVMKKFINSQVIKLDPFKRSFIFWKSNNPYFSYSFSEPKKNQIVLDLIGFIKTAQKPILDDFFEQNNLRHKQGYLQTLLDASEDAGIFEFHRQNNDVLIKKGVNFKSFLEGRIRKA